MHHEIRTYLRRLAMEHIKPNYAELGRAFNVDPRTIKKAFLEMQNDNSDSGKPKNKPFVLDPYKELLEQKFNHGVNAHAAYHFIRHKGYTGSYTTVKRYARQFKSFKIKKATIRIETTPGLSAQVDWKEDVILHTTDGEAHKFSVFLFVLGYSRFSYIQLVTDRNQTTLFRSLINAFEIIGGIPYEIWFDNMRQVVNHTSQFEQKMLNPRFESFASDAGFMPITHQVYRPQTKGKVESLAGVVKRRLKVYDYEFTTPDQFEIAINEITDNINNQTSQAINDLPINRLITEKEHFIPLNKQLIHTYIDNRHYRKVSHESMIVYQSNKYSVPSKYIGL